MRTGAADLRHRRQGSLADIRHIVGSGQRQGENRRLLANRVAGGADRHNLLDDADAVLIQQIDDNLGIFPGQLAFGHIKVAAIRSQNQEPVQSVPGRDFIRETSLVGRCRYRRTSSSGSSVLSGTSSLTPSFRTQNRAHKNPWGLRSSWLPTGRARFKQWASKLAAVGILQITQRHRLARKTC